LAFPEISAGNFDIAIVGQMPATHLALGYQFESGPLKMVGLGKPDATVSRGGEAMRLEWVTDAAFRFFPTQPDELFGYVLHPIDLATNKASAAADRRGPAILSIWSPSMKPSCRLEP
jgi:hypothetical protein